MRTDSIFKIWIDNTNRLCIEPKTANFKMIYRSAMGVNWSDARYLHSQIMRKRTPVDWFRQILAALKIEYDYLLYITEKTEWENIDETNKDLIKVECEKSLRL